jgi:hypothetical protein
LVCKQLVTNSAERHVLSFRCYNIRAARGCPRGLCIRRMHTQVSLFRNGYSSMVCIAASSQQHERSTAGCCFTALPLRRACHRWCHLTWCQTIDRASTRSYTLHPSNTRLHHRRHFIQSHNNTATQVSKLCCV